MSTLAQKNQYSNLSPPQEIAIINFLRNCYAFFKAHKRIPPPDRIFGFDAYFYLYNSMRCWLMYCHIFYIRNSDISKSVSSPPRILQLRVPRIYLNPFSSHGSEQFGEISFVQLQSKLAEFFLRETRIL